jgi:hypothetical protein
VETSLFRKFLNLAIVLLIVHAGWKVGPVVVRHFKFKDKITDAARYSGSDSVADLRKTILTIAESTNVPLEPEALSVHKTGEHVRVEADYTEQLEVLPRYFYLHEFAFSIDTPLAQPMRPGETR